MREWEIEIERGKEREREREREACYPALTSVGLFTFIHPLSPLRGKDWEREREREEKRESSESMMRIDR